MLSPTNLELPVHIAKYYYHLLLDSHGLVYGVRSEEFLRCALSHVSQAAENIPPHAVGARAYVLHLSPNRRQGNLRRAKGCWNGRGTARAGHREDAVRGAVHPVIFPSVMVLALSYNMASIVHCFPTVQALTYHYAGSNRLLDTYKGNAQIHTINKIALSSDAAKRVSTSICLHDAVPWLKHLSVWRDVHPNTIRLQTTYLISTSAVRVLAHLMLSSKSPRPANEHFGHPTPRFQKSFASRFSNQQPCGCLTVVAALMI
ncbi:hypothetical protein C8R44DRAFT_889830 [Mycena epipterygia]|nr:hypothetical protein C8R44DRAFT_889830 [Mycena epipterygia]